MDIPDELQERIEYKGGEVDEDSDHPVHEEFTEEDDGLEG